MPSITTRPASRRTATTFAVLGLLSVQNWTTYELAKQVKRSLNWFWPRAERKLYDEPKALVAGGLASARREFTGQRPRTVYEITDDGRAALRDWLDEPPAPRSTEFEAMLKVFFADAGSLEQLTTTIRAIEAEAAQRLEDLVAMADAARTDGPLFPQRRHISALALRLQFDQEAAVLRWARWALEQASRWDSTSDPGGWDERAVLAEIVAAHAALSDSGTGGDRSVQA